MSARALPLDGLAYRSSASMTREQADDAITDALRLVTGAPPRPALPGRYGRDGTTVRVSAPARASRVRRGTGLGRRAEMSR